MKKMLSLLMFCSIITLVSCKEDEDPSKDGAQSTGLWTAKLNGAAWQSDRIEKKIYISSVAFLAYGAADESVMIISFTGDAQVKRYLVNEPEGVTIDYSSNSSQPSTTEFANEGDFNITKYDSDSLVATFAFKTPTRTFTEGKVKIKLN